MATALSLFRLVSALLMYLNVAADQWASVAVAVRLDAEGVGRKAGAGLAAVVDLDGERFVDAVHFGCAGS